MNARKNIELNMSAVINELKILRQTLNQINDTLMRKLGRPAPTVPLNNKQEQGNIHRYSIRTSQVKSKKKSKRVHSTHCIKRQ